VPKTNPTSGVPSTASNPNPNNWPLGVRIYPAMSGNVRLLRLAARKSPDGAFSPARDAKGGPIQVRVKNNPAAVGQAVFDLERGVHGIPVS